MSACLSLRPTLYEETVPGGGHTSFVLKRGQLLRLTDLEGGANVSVMLLNAHEKSERLNLPDTLKGQHTAKLTAGHCLYSDMGRVLAAITADTCGWHDSFGGVLNADEVAEKYGEGRYQELRNGFFRGHRRRREREVVGGVEQFVRNDAFDPVSMAPAAASRSSIPTSVSSSWKIRSAPAIEDCMTEYLADRSRRGMKKRRIQSMKT